MMTRLLDVVTLSLLFGASFGGAFGFRQSFFIPRGIYNSNVAGFDVDRDGVNELIFSSLWTSRPDSSALLFYSCKQYDRYMLADSICTLTHFPLFSAIGDIDNDSLVDVIVKGWNSAGNYWYTGVYEAASPCSFPKRLVWSRRNATNACDMTHYITDLDKDGLKEILFPDPYYPTVYECTGDNRYSLVFLDSLNIYNYAFAVGDFDTDGRMEFGACDRPQDFVVFENTGPDRYEIVWTYHDNSSIMVDDACSALPDLNHNGRPEMMFGMELVIDHTIYAAGLFIFESTGDNQFRMIFRDSMEYPIGDMGTEKRSDFGDIDGDGETELVWSAGRDWWVYKWIGGEFVKIHSQYNGNNRCSRTTNLCVYDLNKNGYPEIVEANGDRVKIWEIEGVRLHHPNGGEVITPGSRFPITWEKFTPPGADSFSIFVSYNNAQTFQTVKTGLTATDTMFLWSIPDTVADSCKIMIWAYGPPRPGQNTPRGTAWDFSDSSFAIRRTGVGEDARYTIHDPRLKILQNPTTARQGIRLLATGYAPSAKLQIYDVSGKVLQSLPITNSQLPITIRCDACGPQGAVLPAGVYFIQLEAGDRTVTRKVVVLE